MSDGVMCEWMCVCVSGCVLDVSVEDDELVERVEGGSCVMSVGGV